MTFLDASGAEGFFGVGSDQFAIYGSNYHHNMAFPIDILVKISLIIAINFVQED